MTVPTVLQSLYDYDNWVNDRLFDVVERVPEARTREEFGGSFDTIHGTYAHILQGEIYYYTRWTGQPLPADGRPADLKTIAELRRRWTEIHGNVATFLESLTPEGVARVVQHSLRGGASWELPLWQLMLQMQNHGTHHRAELADMLTRVGHVPPPTDYIVFCNERTHGQAGAGLTELDLTIVRSLYAYHYWVTDRLLDLAEQVPLERTRERFGGSFDTIHGTLVHLLSAEFVWGSRWHGVSPTSMLKEDEFADVKVIRARWAEQRPQVQRFVDAVTAEQASAPLAYTNTSGVQFELPTWQPMVQLVSHGTHHRAELADMLTRVGLPPAPTDYSVFCQEQPALASGRAAA